MRMVQSTEPFQQCRWRSSWRSSTRSSAIPLMHSPLNNLGLITQVERFTRSTRRRSQVSDESTTSEPQTIIGYNEIDQEQLDTINAIKALEVSVATLWKDIA